MRSWPAARTLALRQKQTQQCFANRCGTSAASRQEGVVLQDPIFQRLLALELHPSEEAFDQLFFEVRGKRAISPKAFTQWLAGLARAGRPRSALRLFSWMEARGHATSVFHYNAAIAACRECDGGLWAEALCLHERMRCACIRPNTVTYNTTISICQIGRKWGQAQQVLKQMRKESVQPDVISFNTAITACRLVHMWTDALHLFKQMHSEVLYPNLVSFNSTISACESSWQWVQALQLLQHMCEATVRTDVISCNAAISACEKSAQWQQGLSLLGHLYRVKLEPSVLTYNAIISACEKGQRWEQALAFQKQMHFRHLAPDVVTFNASLSACEKGVQWALALHILRDIEVSVPTVVTYSAAISACEKGRRWSEALGLLLQLRSVLLKPNEVSYGAVVKACERTQQWAECLELLAQMSDQVVQRNVIICSTAISACAQSSLWAPAFALLATFLDRQQPSMVFACGAAIAAAARTGRSLELGELLTIASSAVHAWLLVKRLSSHLIVDHAGGDPLEPVFIVVQMLHDYARLSPQAERAFCRGLLATPWRSLVLLRAGGAGAVGYAQRLPMQADIEAGSPLMQHGVGDDVQWKAWSSLGSWFARVALEELDLMMSHSTG